MLYEVITAAVSMSQRYLNDRFLPDKAIDLIDEACVRVRLKSGSGTKNKNELTDLFSEYLSGNITRTAYSQKSDRNNFV